VIAFSAIMALLSVVVTALAQATQATFRLRARNLQRGLEAVLERELPARKDQSRKFAANLLNSSEIATLRRRSDTSSLVNRFRGPMVSWIDHDTLRKALEASQAANDRPKHAASPDNPHVPEPAPLPPGIDIDSTVERFKKLDGFMCKRFGVAMRTVSLCWAVVVAIAFQVSAPQLLQQLSSSPERRERALAVADNLNSAPPATTITTTGVNAAFQQLQRAHPDLRSRLDRLSFDSSAPESAAEDLAAAIEDLPERAQIVSEFEDLIDRQRIEQAAAQLQASVNQLAAIDITLWRQGNAFYWREGRVQVNNIFGVLATIALLSLGAPFWFNTLKQSLALRDVLSPDKKNAGDRTSSSEDATQRKDENRTRDKRERKKGFRAAGAGSIGRPERGSESRNSPTPADQDQEEKL
jgi:hypothetical protein